MAKNSLQAHKAADAAKWVITFLLFLGIIAAVVTLFFQVDRQTTVERIGAESFSIGTLDESGAGTEEDTAIYTKNAFTTDGLKVEMNADAEVTYVLYFYDADDEFISATETLSADFDGEIPEGAEYARVMITPTADEDGKVSFIEVLGYANALTITVNR